jgi:hypothetical protein
MGVNFQRLPPAIIAPVHFVDEVAVFGSLRLSVG